VKRLVILAGVALLAVGVVSLALRVHRPYAFKRQLLSNATRIWPHRLERPTPDSLGGPESFGELAEPILAALRSAASKWAVLASSGRTELVEIAEARRAPSDTSPEVDRLLERDGLMVDRLLAATHARSVTLPPSLTGDAEGWDAIDFAGEVSAARILRQVEAGDAVAGVRGCVDGLALARDCALSGGRLGRVHAGVLVRLLFWPCTQAFDAAPVFGKREGLEHLRVVTQRWPGDKESFLRAKAVEDELMIAGGAIEEAERVALAPGARAAVEGMRVTQDESWLERWGRLSAAAAHAENMEAVISACLIPTLRGRACSSAWEKAGKDRSMLNPFSMASSLAFARAEDRLEDETRARLHLILSAATADLHRAEKGSWPTVRSLGLPKSHEAFVLLAPFPDRLALVHLREATSLEISVDPVEGVERTAVP